jgi:YHS domain-containing protein
MATNTPSALLADPICGKPVGPESPHRQIHSGALYCFCSEACRARFAEHPARSAFIALSGGVRPLASAPDSRPPTATIEPRPQTLHDLDQAQVRGLYALLRAWRERRFARLCCRELLRLHKSIAARHPELAGDRLYRQVVAARIGGDPGAADAVIERAARSYAIWPVERALTFRDVVHYLAVSEFMASRRGTPWVHAGMKRVVDASIPAHL